ncbi:universal stress protein [Collimonas sp.]|jgi:nucleotide-binding universal stress UspA family protein|uniref:universal stress protein n=1 Tax=Collimonas sp. TaxID=1963772 RepID=UPI002C5354EC|nr:universal stress protein [Collimonas sp.]HWW05282.1 universal stress protein [Collimonas sp.]
MQKILVPVDGSDYALRAVQYAGSMVKSVVRSGTPAQIHLLNVQEHLDGKIQAYLSLDKIKAMETAAADQVLQPAKRMLEELDVPYIASTRIGPIAKSIVDYVQDEKCDCIVMGTHGRGALGNLILGSTMNKVIHLVHVPVTLIR